MLGWRRTFLMWMILHQELIGWCSIANSTWCIAFSIERNITNTAPLCYEKVFIVKNVVSPRSVCNPSPLLAEGLGSNDHGDVGKLKVVLMLSSIYQSYITLITCKSLCYLVYYVPSSSLKSKWGTWVFWDHMLACFCFFSCRLTFLHKYSFNAFLHRCPSALCQLVWCFCNMCAKEQ